MFTNFSLYPGGAFLMCESVGEYDDNVQLPRSEERRVGKECAA